MASPREKILNVLLDLRDHDQFKRFKWYLSDSENAIPESELDRADRPGMVDLMVQRYLIDKALEITRLVLMKMGRNDLAQRLPEVKGLQNPDCETRKTRPDETAAQTQQMIQERRAKIEEIQDSVKLSGKSAECRINETERVFTQLIDLVKKTRKNLRKELEEEERATREEAKRLVQELEGEICELERRSVHVEHQQPSDRKWAEVCVSRASPRETVTTMVSELRENFHQQTEALLDKTKLIQAQQFEVDVTLDPDTAHPDLVLLEEGKQVHCGRTKGDVPESPQRFNLAPNVLAQQSFALGKFYYEVQVEGKTRWDVGVVNGSINRKGSIKGRPEDGFWTVCLRLVGQYKANKVLLSLESPLKRVGVFVDFDQRSVSFFNVDSAKVFHRFTDCSFKGNLYPFFSPGTNHANTKPLIICPVQHTQ